MIIYERLSVGGIYLWQNKKTAYIVWLWKTESGLWCRE